MAIGYRCLNDMFAYCNGTPKVGDKPIDTPIGLGNGCVHDLKTCRHYVSAKAKDAIANVEKNTAKKE